MGQETPVEAEMSAAVAVLLALVFAAGQQILR